MVRCPSYGGVERGFGKRFPMDFWEPRLERVGETSVDPHGGVVGLVAEHTRMGEGTDTIDPSHDRASHHEYTESSHFDGVVMRLDEYLHTMFAHSLSPDTSRGTTSS